MIELDDATRRVLLRRAGPPVGSRERVLAGLRANIGPGGSGAPGDGGGSGAGPGPELAAATRAGALAVGQGASVVWWAKVAALTLGLATAGLGVLAGGAAGVRSLAAPASPPALVVGAGDEAESALGAGPRSADALAGPQPETALEVSAAASPRSATPAPNHRAAAPTAEQPPASSAASALDAEAELVRAAKRETNPARALELLDGHASAHPNGALARERDALRIHALCELGDAEAAASARSEYLARYPDAPILPKSCED